MREGTPVPLYFSSLLFTSHRSPLSERLEQARSKETSHRSPLSERLEQATLATTHSAIHGTLKWRLPRDSTRGTSQLYVLRGPLHSNSFSYIDAFLFTREGGGGKCLWPLRKCAAGQGMVFVLSVLNRVHNFVRVCPKHGEGIQFRTSLS